MSITPLMPVYPRCGFRPVRGDHCHLIGEDGRRYLDFAAGIAVNSLGHSPSVLVKARLRYAGSDSGVDLALGPPAAMASACGLSQGLAPLAGRP